MSTLLTLGDDVAYCIRVYDYDVRGVDSYLNPAWVTELAGGWWDHDIAGWCDWDDPPAALNRFMRAAMDRREAWWDVAA